MPTRSVISFGAFQLNLDIGEIRKRGRKVKLPPQPFQVLALLVNSPGQLVTREAIREEVWGSETYVDFDHGLNFCIRKIREVLGESAKAHYAARSISTAFSLSASTGVRSCISM